MTTVIPALSGGMGSAKTVSPSGETGKPSAFSALLAQASHDTGGSTQGAGPAPSMFAPVSNGKPVPAESDGEGLGDETLADKVVSGEEEDKAEVAEEVPLANDSATYAEARAETRAGEVATNEDAEPLADGQTMPFSLPGGKALPQAATPSAEGPVTEVSVTGEAVTKGEKRAVLGMPVANEEREPAGPLAQKSMAGPEIRARNEAPVQTQAPAEPPAGKVNNVGTTSSSMAAGKPAEVKPHLRTVEHNSKGAGAPESNKAAAKPSRAAGTKNEGISLAGMTPMGNPAEPAKTSPLDPPAAGVASGMDVREGIQAQAQRHPAGEPAAVTQTRPAFSQAANPSEPAPVVDESEPVEPEPGQAARSRQDAAVIRQESQRQPATPEWLAQIEHGRRWQQAQHTGTAAPATGQPEAVHAEVTDTEGPVADKAATASEPPSEQEAVAPHFERLADATALARGGVAGETGVQQPVAAQDGQQPLAAVSSGREAGATAPERAPLLQGDRVLNLHQGAPEQNARQLSQQVQVMVNQELQEADIRLNPSELGGMRIQLKFEQGEVSMHIQAQHTQARELLEQAMPRLRDLLGQQGIQLGQGQVGGFAGQQGSAQNGASGQGATGRENGHNPAPFEQGSGDSGPAHGHHVAGSFANDGRIDFFA